MLSSTSSGKRGGSGLSGLFDNPLIKLTLVQKVIDTSRCLKALLLASAMIAALQSSAEAAGNYKASKAAAESCNAKLIKMEEYAASGKSGGKPIRFSQDEVNSYLALDLRQKYHSSLRNLLMIFGEDHMQAIAEIDFDRLEMSSSKLLPKLMSMLFSGTHVLSAGGKLITRKGKGSFKLEQARFDGSSLPRSLVEQIISLVGRKQNPPFDPLQPSEMPYRIQRVEVHAGYLIVYQ
jgi:hypothetical protein